MIEVVDKHMSKYAQEFQPRVHRFATVAGHEENLAWIKILQGIIYLIRLIQHREASLSSGRPEWKHQTQFLDPY